MKYEIGEILNQAIMTGTISLVVEGIDDIKIYETISNEVGKMLSYFLLDVLKDTHQVVVMLFLQWMQSVSYQKVIKNTKIHTWYN